MDRCSICVTLREKDMDTVLSRSRACKASGADIVEIRLDHLEKVDWRERDHKGLEGMGLRTILTLRPAWEGGFYIGSEKDRASLLGRALNSGTDIIDIELGMGPSLRDDLISTARSKGVTSIVSFHDMERTPSLSEMERILGNLEGTGGDILKVAVRANSMEDASNIIELTKLAKDRGLRFAIMGIGAFGQITRVLSPVLGSELVYTSLDDMASTDQIDIRTLRRTWHSLGMI